MLIFILSLLLLTGFRQHLDESGLPCSVLPQHHSYLGVPECAFLNCQLEISLLFEKLK